MARYRLDLIGPFGLFEPSGRRIEVTSKKAMALIALIISSPGGARGRRWLETMLWGTRGAAQAQASLRRELANLAKQLTAHGAGHLLVRGMQRVGLAIDDLEVDMFARGISTGRHLRGDFLEGLDLKDCEEFEDWLRDERERLRRMLAVEIPASPPLSPPADVLGMPLPGAREMLANTPPRLPPKPSLVVLPFEELGARHDSWLGTAIADEIGVLLSSFPQLFIVASASARALAGQGLVPQEIAVRLGVRYLLDGTVAGDGARLRVSVMLIDGVDGEQVWAETFSGAAEGDLLQTEIAAHVTPQIWTSVDTAERRRTLQLARPAVGNYEIYWRANALVRSWRETDVLEAVTLASQLAADEPTCPWATSLAAYCHSLAWLLHYAPHREVSRRSAILHYQAAVQHGSDNVEALGYAAGTLLNLGGDLDMADRLISHALTLLPAHQPTLFWGGWVDVVRGMSDRARQRFELALRINPATGARVPTLCGIGFACLLQERVDEASQFFAEAQAGGPEFILAGLGMKIVGGLRSHAGLDQTMLANPVVAQIIGMFRDPTHRRLLYNAIHPGEAVRASY